MAAPSYSASGGRQHSLRLRVRRRCERAARSGGRGFEGRCPRQSDFVPQGSGRGQVANPGHPDELDQSVAVSPGLPSRLSNCVARSASLLTTASRRTVWSTPLRREWRTFSRPHLSSTCAKIWVFLQKCLVLPGFSQFRPCKVFCIFRLATPCRANSCDADQNLGTSRT